MPPRALAVLACMCLLAGGGAPAAAEMGSGSELPWALRDHYRFTVDNTTLLYAVEDAQWEVQVEEVGVVVRNAGFRITFADGVTWDASDLGKAGGDRKTFDTEIGKTTVFWCDFPPNDGLIVRHTITKYAERPFVLAGVSVANTGEKPIEIAKIETVVLGADAMPGLSAETGVKACHIVYRGMCPVFDKSAPPALTFFHDAGHGVCLAFGVSPRGAAVSGAEFRSSGGAWQGEVASVFDPLIRIAPSEKFEADPAWLSVNVPDPALVDQYYAWAMSLLPRPETKGPKPLWWVTVEEGAPFAKLLGALDLWPKNKDRSVLVPWAWEGRPGSLKGAAPRYPMGMAKAASVLGNAGAKPGLTVDPLLTDSGAPEWTATSPDGRTWINPAAPEGRAHAVERMKRAAKWGFEFFVIQKSDIPDDALKQFNITRTQADSLAFGVMAEAAPGWPVFPAAAHTLEADLDQWLEAAASSARMGVYGLTPGPVRMNVSESRTLDGDVVAAMSLFRGPVEFTGRPRPGAIKRLGAFLSERRKAGGPVDAANSSPKQWRLDLRDSEDGKPGSSLMTFPGSGRDEPPKDEG